VLTIYVSSVKVSLLHFTLTRKQDNQMRNFLSNNSATIKASLIITVFAIFTLFFFASLMVS
jgi:hypothetical protein